MKVISPAVINQPAQSKSASGSGSASEPTAKVGGDSLAAFGDISKVAMHLLNLLQRSITRSSI